MMAASNSAVISGGRLMLIGASRIQIDRRRPSSTNDATVSGPIIRAQPSSTGVGPCQIVQIRLRGSSDWVAGKKLAAAVTAKTAMLATRRADAGQAPDGARCMILAKR